MSAAARIPTPKFEVNYEDDPLQIHPAYLEATAPIGFWRMEALSGTTEEDQTANNRDLTYVNAPTLLADGAFTDAYSDLNPSVQFNGTDEYAETAASSVWQNLTAEWTLAAWVYPTAVGKTPNLPTGIIAPSAPSAGNVLPFGLFFGDATNFMGGTIGSRVWTGFRTGAGTVKWAYINTGDLTDNTWTQLVATWDGTSLTLYKDAVAATMTTGGTATAPTAAGSTVKLQVGRAESHVTSGAAVHFQGRIDEPAIWDRALRADEVTNLHRYHTVNEPDDANFRDLTALPDSKDGTSISRLRSFSPRRGRSDPISRIGAATATVVLSNNDGLLSPAPIVNVLPNPSGEVQEAGLPFQGQGGVVTYDTAHVRTGLRAWKLTTTTAAAAYATTEAEGLIGMEPGETYVFSGYPYVETVGDVDLADVTFEIVDEIAGVEQATASGNPGAFDTYANRLEVTRTIRADADAAYVRVKLISDGVAGRYIHFDDMQLEKASVATAFVYGESADCTWLGEAHRSPTVCRADGYRKAGLPWRACRLYGTWDGTDYDVIHGYVERAIGSFPAYGEDAVVTYSVVDGTRILSNISMRGFSRSSERVGDRVRAILAFAGIPTSRIDVDDEHIDVLALTTQAELDDDTSALALIQDIEQTERGEFFVSKDGMFTYQGSLARTTSAARAVVFSDEDDAVEIRYSDVAWTVDIGTVANDVNIENVASGNNHSFDYPLSQARYFPIARSEQSKWATDIANDDDRSIPLPNAEQVTVFGAKNPDAWWPTLLDLELGSLCRIERHHAGVDLWQGYVHFLEGYSIDASPGRWTMSFLTSPTLAHPITADPWQTPITRPILLASGQATSGDIVVPSRTYRDDRLYVLFVHARRTDASIPSQPTFTSSNTWTSERQDTATSATDSHRFSAFRTIPTADVTESLGINFATDPDRTVAYFILEIAAGFNVADPIGATNYPGTGSQFSGTMDVGTLVDARSIVVMQSWKAGGNSPVTYSGAVKLAEHLTPGGSSHAACYGNIPGVDSIGYSYVLSGGLGHQALEVKAE